MVERLELGPVVAMCAQAFPYVRIDASGFFTPQDLAARLSDPQLGQFLVESRRAAVVLNASMAERIGSEDTQWIGAQWAGMLASTGVRKLSIVTPEPVHALFGAVFQSCAVAAARAGVEVRCFPSAQFTQSWESVSWFDAPVSTSAAAATSAPPSSAATPTAVATSAASVTAANVHASPASAAAAGSVELAVPTEHRGAALASGALGGLFTGLAAATAWFTALRSLGLVDVIMSDALRAVGAVFGAMVGLAGTGIVLLLMGVPRSRVTWDASTITEWVGGSARTILRRDVVQHALLEVTVQMVRRTRAVTGVLHGGRVLQLFDSAGQRITLSTGEFRPAWLRNRPCRVDSLEAIAALVGRPAVGAVVPDDRAYSRPASLFFGAVAVLSYAAFVAGALLVRTHDYNSDAQGAALLGVGALVFAARALWPVPRFFRARPGGRLAAGTEIALRLGVAFAVGVPALIAVTAAFRY